MSLKTVFALVGVGLILLSGPAMATTVPLTDGQAPTLCPVNTAGLEDLIALPGVGPAIAQRIVEYRETQGLFSTEEDLLKVRGIGSKVLEKLRPLISFEMPQPPVSSKTP